MQYVSTRGNAPILEFEDVLLAGLARDGGLYLPEYWPEMSPDIIAGLCRKPYAEAAFEVMYPFIGGKIPDGEFHSIIEDAYRSFRHAAVAPLVQIGPNAWILELFHGPTLAFKDFAMQVLARLMDRTLKVRGTRSTIVGATSGDTGGAAIEAFRGLEAVDIFILHPEGRVSDVQRKQMTTVTETNVHNIAVQGTFDDCQALVKRLFGDFDLRDRLQLAGVNSINWARIMAQIVYYFWAASHLGAPGRPLRFSVPTGNFGDIFAGYAAKKMGLPIERLIMGTNVNDILIRMLNSGRYEPKGVVATQSPSMDIQVSSNFERLLFELSGRSADTVNQRMAALSNYGAFDLGGDEKTAFNADFTGHKIDEQETSDTINALYQECGMIVDPHTAVGIAVARKEQHKGQNPIVTLATAHPAKFPKAIENAIGQAPVLPKGLSRRLDADERFEVLENDYGVVSAYIAERSHALKELAR